MAMRLQRFLSRLKVIMATRMISIAAILLCAVIAVPAGAQTTSPQDKPAQEEARSTGLPASITWKFNFDAGWGTFGFANSLYDNPKEPGVDENLSDQWFEGYMKPALSGTYTTSWSSEIYGKVSAVGERTYGSVPAEFGADVSSFGPEDLYIGWRSGKSLTIGDNALDFTVGRTRYRLGHGFLLYDGAAEGGSLLDQRASGVRVCGDRAPPTGSAQVRVVLSRQGRTR
jgi:hypothetical protein